MRRTVKTSQEKGLACACALGGRWMLAKGEEMAA